MQLNTPIGKIQQLFYEEHPGGNFAGELGWYIEHGAFRSDSRIAYLARPADTRVRSSYAGGDREWDTQQPNAWFIAYCAGDIAAIADALKSVKPHYPYIIWGRARHELGRWRVNKTKDFLNKIKLYGKISTSFDAV